MKLEGGARILHCMHPNYTRRELIAARMGPRSWRDGRPRGHRGAARHLRLETLLALASVVVYGVTLVAMLVFSACYNLIPVAAWKDRLRRCDQANLPQNSWHLHAVRTGEDGRSVGLHLAGAGVADCSARRRGEGSPRRWLAKALGGALSRIGMGRKCCSCSLSLLRIPSGRCFSSGSAAWRTTCGVVFHVWDELPYQNVIWHVFVLGGTALHFAAVTYAMT